MRLTFKLVDFQKKKIPLPNMGGLHQSVEGLKRTKDLGGLPTESLNFSQP